MMQRGHDRLERRASPRNFFLSPIALDLCALPTKVVPSMISVAAVAPVRPLIQEMSSRSSSSPSCQSDGSRRQEQKVAGDRAIDRSFLKRIVSVEDSAATREHVNKKRRRARSNARVYFNDHANVLHYDPLVMSHPERRSVWYSPRELVNMKRAAQRDSQDVDIDKPLFCAYGSNRVNIPETQHHEEERTSMASIEKFPYELTAAASNNQERASFLYKSPAFAAQRGLERWCSASHAMVRRLTVLQVRCELFLEQSNSALGQTTKSNPKRLASVYHAASAPAARYARVLGLADAELAKAVNATSVDPNSISGPWENGGDTHSVNDQRLSVVQL
eukprot:CAMPEP_0172450440 /NCGR_PEP_ID=MMETSP1065-20121228/8773_1 /TAXON_ID=265537 /ORGANISM="Amphiprora paludosa, Strain CCMP125" /LENGTH=332 /DNA_ID=CAMNT_0013202221 /DNA_START=279 /DNA_END=1277 /DNA_ORIENTATION=-